MRDGVRLYTAVYVPKGGKDFPILMERTPYGSEPYGKGAMPDFEGPYVKAGYAFASQDVRGTFLSGGTFENVRPFRPGKPDEATDTYDTIDYLVKHVAGNNGRVGLRGISYPGFYAAAGALSRHPALRAVSPQAPVTNWFVGDDVHHNGGFFLQDNFSFSAWFDVPRKGPETEHKGIELPETSKNAYAFYLDGGSAEALEKRYFKGRSPYWKEIVKHPNYDGYWKARALEGQIRDVRCAVLTVGGWFDAEDLWGALNLYAATERQSPGIENDLVMGPWTHGQWAEEGRSTGGMDWGSDTAAWYRENVEFPFFDKHLRGTEGKPVAEATMFETGTNVWRRFEVWPPKGLSPQAVYLDSGGKLASSTPALGNDAYVNDPLHPTPYLADPATEERPQALLAQDEAWAAKRKDVLTYSGGPLGRATTLAGPIDVDLWVTTTGTDGDFVVKLLDLAPNGEPHAGEMRTVRADVIRGRFRRSLSTPEAFVPGEPTEVRMRMNDVLHTFKAGHRMVVQVQSSWFPLVDRNPNRFVPNVEKAVPGDFQRATVRVLRGGKRASALRFGVLR